MIGGMVDPLRIVGAYIGHDDKRSFRKSSTHYGGGVC